VPKGVLFIALENRIMTKLNYTSLLLIVHVPQPTVLSSPSACSFVIRET
jgi:hypothetical protein